MKFLPFMLLALPVFAGTPGGALAPITLYVHYEKEAPPEIVDAMTSEVQTIMAPIGLTFEWRDMNSNDGTTISVALAVINFKGNCDLSGLNPRDYNPGRLGWTHISDGVILPFADIHCSAVRQFIQREIVMMRPSDRNQAFGKALGRVLAHELFHIFANTTHHGSNGVGRQYYTVRDLLTTDFQFQERDSIALKTSKVHGALAAAADTQESQQQEPAPIAPTEKLRM